MFASDFFRRFPSHKLPNHSVPVECCTCCASVADTDCNINLDQVRITKNGCELCALLLRKVKSYCMDGERNVQIVRRKWWLQAGREGPRILRLYYDSEYSDDNQIPIPISFPTLPEPENPARFALIRAWLDCCDNSHSCNKREIKRKATMPTRLLDVGDPDPEVLRLHCPHENDKVKYVALSHRWGKCPPTKEDPQFCTTDMNVKARRGQFSFSELPKTFQDAIYVTRELHIQYLWIDSLCIIQWNDEDWKHEAERMEGVFSSAYCTIAATSAGDSKAGFLTRNVHSEVVYTQDPSGRRFYVCDDTDNFNNFVDIDDFDEYIEKAELNKRSWVMQERVLSRRTIHFSEKQMFWECGEGVYCETFTKLESSFRKKYFMLDPYFPERLVQSGHQRTLEFIHFLFEEYSKRGLTKKTDRRVAMSGLEARIARARGCEKRYGVFQQFLHRNLLWQSSDKKLNHISYDRTSVPSWSWMAYDGGIQFISIPFNTVGWINNLRFDTDCESTLIADVGKFHNCTMKLAGDCYDVFNFLIKRGWVRYDVVEGSDIDEERCVVIGKKATEDVKEYYILVVRPTSVDGEYSRVGVGLIGSDCVVRERVGVRVV